MEKYKEFKSLNVIREIFCGAEILVNVFLYAIPIFLPILNIGYDGQPYSFLDILKVVLFVPMSEMNEIEQYLFSNVEITILSGASVLLLYVMLREFVKFLYNVTHFDWYCKYVYYQRIFNAKELSSAPIEYETEHFAFQYFAPVLICSIALASNDSVAFFTFTPYAFLVLILFFTGMGLGIFNTVYRDKANKRVLQSINI